MRDTKPEQIYPKTEALPGSLQPVFVRCGRPACRCACGVLHGPYWRRVWREDGRTRKAYVPVDEVDRVAVAVARWRHRHPSRRSLLRELRAVLSLMG